MGYKIGGCNMGTGNRSRDVHRGLFRTDGHYVMSTKTEIGHDHRLTDSLSKYSNCTPQWFLCAVIIILHTKQSNYNWQRCLELKFFVVLDGQIRDAWCQIIRYNKPQPNIWRKCLNKFYIFEIKERWSHILTSHNNELYVTYFGYPFQYTGCFRIHQKNKSGNSPHDFTTKILYGRLCLCFWDIGC